MGLHLSGICENGNMLNYDLSPPPRQRHLMLRPLFHVLDLPEEVVEVRAPVHKVHVGSIDDEEGSFRIAEEELVVRLVHRGDVVAAQFFFECPAALLDAGDEGFGVRLEEDDEVRTDDLGLEQGIYLFIEGELVVVQVQVGEYPVLGKEIVADGALIEQIGLGHFFLLAKPVQKEERLGLKTEAHRIFVKIRKKGVVLRPLVDKPGLHLLGKEGCETRLAHADRPFDHDISGIMESAWFFVHYGLPYGLHLATRCGSFSSWSRCAAVFLKTGCIAWGAISQSGTRTNFRTASRGCGMIIAGSLIMRSP